VRAGDLVFLSGMVPRDRNGQLQGSEIKEQTLAVIDNIRLALESVGGSLQDVCSVTTYLVDLERDFDGYNAAYASRFTRDAPARATVQASLRGFLIEIQCIAVLQPQSDG
jgi:enamine deaminase RidA (YjgF/YER057c/UK114 family)